MPPPPGRPPEGRDGPDGLDGLEADDEGLETEDGRLPESEEDEPDDRTTGEFLVCWFMERCTGWLDVTKLLPD